MKTSLINKGGVKCTLMVITTSLLILASPALAIEDQETAPVAEMGVETEANTGSKLEWSFGGTFQTDLRFQLQEKSVPLELIDSQGQKQLLKNFYIGKDFYRRTLPTGVERNQNLLQVKFKAAYDQFSGVADIDFFWAGYPGPIAGIEGLSDITEVDPFYIKVHSLYLQASNLFVKGFDLRVGEQTISWGVGDQFNPTNTLNPNDLEDVLLFGNQLSNLMIRADYSPVSEWMISGVLVPIFKPALLPRSASLGLAAVDRLPFLDNNLRYRILSEKALAESLGSSTVLTGVDPEMPETSLKNMQFEFRVAGTIAKQDIALSYYHGFSDIPVPFKDYTSQVSNQPCPPDVDPSLCVHNALTTKASLTYPRMQVFGLNMAGEVNPLGWISNKITPLGYRFELAVVLPERRQMALYQDNLFGIYPAGEYDYGLGGQRPTIIESTPFLKWVLGLDYTFNDNFYLNVMWVHGLPDEFGAGDFLHEGYVVRKGTVPVAPIDSTLPACVLGINFGGQPSSCAAKYPTEIQRSRIGDYIVFGLDIHFADDKALIRLFNILEVTGYYKEYWSNTDNTRVRHFLSPFGEGFSMVVYPEFDYNFGNGLDLGFGALLQLGKDFTKFGDPAAGGSIVWTRARYRF